MSNLFALFETDNLRMTKPQRLLVCSVFAPSQQGFFYQLLGFASNAATTGVDTLLSRCASF